jgi:molecular chaperone DnaK
VTRTTIDFGIDLGTTNSAVAVARGVGTDIIKNEDDSDTTPSAVWIDRRGHLYVGRAARDRAESDPDNTAREFKQQMGLRDAAVDFEASARLLSPEELSAQVLRSMIGDVRQRLGEEVTEAVITVPAAFDLASCAATRRAAELAGLDQAVLLQEPTAASLAYGFQIEDTDAAWLVYDLGGGTFDAAVVQLRDGELQVVGHRGDNFLGGKLLDWRIVDEVLLPEARTLLGRPELRRGPAELRLIVNKLKLAAEAAKVRLSRQETVTVLTELDTGEGRRVEFECELSRAVVAGFAEPIVSRSVHLCRAALRDAGLAPGDLDRVLLVGGPTLAPYVRERLADPVGGLGVPLDFTQDPLTVVARGAAIFASTQRRIEPASSPPSEPGALVLRAEYEPVGPDEDPLIGGTLGGADGEATGLTIEFVNADARPPWRSGQAPVKGDGRFAVRVWAERGRTNAFTVEVTDAAGRRRAVSPDVLTYTIGAIETAPRLTHNVGVAISGNRVHWLAHRNVRLPVRGRQRLQTTVTVARGRPGDLVRIPLVEGEHARADRNRIIGSVEVPARDVPRDLPRGTEIELTVEIDTSRQVTARAWVPSVEQEYEALIQLNPATPKRTDLERGARRERARLARLRDDQARSGEATAGMMIANLDETDPVPDLERLLDAAEAEPVEAAACEQRLADLRVALDEIEDALGWPAAVEKAEAAKAWARDRVDSEGTPEERRRLAEAIAGLDAARGSRDEIELDRRVDDVVAIAVATASRTGSIEVDRFLAFEHQASQSAAAPRVRELLIEGRAAMAMNDRPTLRRVNAELGALLPGRRGGEGDGGIGSGVDLWR